MASAAATRHGHLRRYWCDSAGGCTDCDGQRYLVHECRLSAQAFVPAIPPTWQLPQFAVGYQTGKTVLPL